MSCILADCSGIAKKNGCAKDELPSFFQLRSTAEKASFWLLSFLAKSTKLRETDESRKGQTFSMTPNDSLYDRLSLLMS